MRSTETSNPTYRHGRGYKNLRYLLLKAQRMTATRTKFVVFKKAGLNCASRRIPAQSRKMLHRRHSPPRNFPASGRHVLVQRGN
jgi:hypothetical protein